MKPRKTKPKTSKLSQVHRSQKALLRVVRGLTEEIGILRRYVLEIRIQLARNGPFETMPEGEDLASWLSRPYSPTDSIDSPQPPLV